MTNDQRGDGAVDLTLLEALRKLARRRSVVRTPAVPDRAAGRMIVTSGGLEAGTLTKATFDRARAAGLVEQVPGTAAWRLSAKGPEVVRRFHSGGPAGAIEPPHEARPGRNPDESPLAWLKRRRAKDGAALISDQQFAAGERLRADFTFAQLAPRVTANWDAALGAASGGRRGAPGSGIEMCDNVLAAAERVNRALRAVGPELSGILVDVCCHLKGLEDLERSIGWPQRSGKVVLQLALTRLARHYGIPDDEAPSRTAAHTPRHWGAEGYRPSIDGAIGTDQPVAD
jgi:hypothetical protein